MRRAAPRWWTAVLVGITAVGTTLGIAQLIAAIGSLIGLLHPTAAPVSALADGFIRITPEWLKDWAIARFGLHDKDALLAGMAVTLLIVAAGLGLLVWRNLESALLMAVLLVVVVLVAVWTRAGADPLDGVPTLLGSLAGIRVLIGSFRRTVTDPEPTRPRSPAIDRRAGPAATDRSAAAGDRSGTRRRTVLRFALWNALLAGGAAVVSRWVPTMQAVEADRARVGVPTVVDLPPAGPATSPAPPVASAPAGSSSPAPGLASGSGLPDSVALDSGGAESTGPASTAAPGSTATLPSATGAPGSSPSSVATGASPDVAPASASAASVAPTSAARTVPFARIAGLTPLTTGNADFYRIDTTLDPPLLTSTQWRLRVHGMVAFERTLDYAALIARPQIERDITMTCVSNAVGGDLIGSARWIGARLADLLAETLPLTGADCVFSTSVDGFTCATPLAAITDGRDAMLAVAMNGVPLPIEHGFPVRMVVPGLYGYVSGTKWVTDLEVTRFDRVTSYWTSRGWSQQGPVKISSRIDTPDQYARLRAGQSVVIAGMAWAQHRGISAVQVQVDDGPWQPAVLSAPLSVDVWRQWQYSWTATPGMHEIRCRAIDAGGTVQDGTERLPIPNGATGYHGVHVTVS